MPIHSWNRTQIWSDICMILHPFATYVIDQCRWSRCCCTIVWRLAPSPGTSLLAGSIYISVNIFRWMAVYLQRFMSRRYVPTITSTPPFFPTETDVSIQYLAMPLNMIYIAVYFVHGKRMSANILSTQRPYLETLTWTHSLRQLHASSVRLPIYLMRSAFGIWLHFILAWTAENHCVRSRSRISSCGLSISVYSRTVRPTSCSSNTIFFHALRFIQRRPHVDDNYLRIIIWVFMQVPAYRLMVSKSQLSQNYNQARVEAIAIFQRYRAIEDIRGGGEGAARWSSAGTVQQVFKKLLRSYVMWGSMMPSVFSASPLRRISPALDRYQTGKNNKLNNNSNPYPNRPHTLPADKRWEPRNLPPTILLVSVN